MSYWEAALLGVIQGLTEFLPISSSGHLVLGKAILGIEIHDIAFEIFVHFGTLLAVLTIFKKDIFLLIGALKSIILLNPKKNDGDLETNNGLLLIGLLVAGTLPAAVVGILFKTEFEMIFSRIDIVCGALIVTGLILIASKLAIERVQNISFSRAFIIGVAQIGAIFPGISRSGTTITAAMLLGVNRIEAARFSFLLAVPLILGATIMQTFELFSGFPTGRQLINLLIGTVTSYLAGLFAIKWLLAVVKEGRFHRFAYYCIVVGIIGFVLISM